MIRRVLLFLVLPPLTFILYAAVSVLHATWTDFSPPPVTPLANEGTPATQSVDSILTCLTYNIGYAGMGKETAFFFDQGKQLHSGDAPVIMPEANVRKNLHGIERLLSAHSADVVLLQEVDRDSKRSHHVDQFEAFNDTLGPVESHFALNYHVRRIPVPNLEPFNVFGKVYSGLSTHSRHPVSRAERISLPGQYGWPDRVFQLDRCILVTRTPFGSGELVIVNLHLSAYDPGGTMKSEQMNLLRDFALAEYASGHHVVLGGDWNQCPPGMAPDVLSPVPSPMLDALNSIDTGFMPQGWTWAWQDGVPTNRDGATAFSPDSSAVSLLDFYLCSPNVDLLEIKTLNEGFDHSDHHAVHARFRLK